MVEPSVSSTVILAPTPAGLPAGCSTRKHPWCEDSLVLAFTPPAFVGSPKQGARPSARLCDGVGSAGRPRAPSLLEPPPLGGGYKERPRLRLALAMLDAPAAALQAKWGHGVGRQARQMRGEIVSTCKDLRVRSKTPTVQTRLYPCLYPRFGDFPFLLRENTRVLLC